MDGRRKTGLVLLILGLALLAPAVQAMMNNRPLSMSDIYRYGLGGGGPSFAKCSDLSNLPCFAAGNSGAVGSTNSTVCTSVLNVCYSTVYCNAGGSLAQCPTFPLGTWQNFPSAVTELFNNQTHEVPFSNAQQNGAGTVNVQLMVNCITASNTANAQLQLQYANVSSFAPPYPSSSFGYNFLGPWTNIGGPAYIDGNGGPSTLPSCINGPNPGSTPWILATSGSLPAVIGNNYDGFYLFRVVGSGGGGTGDNPRFGGIWVMVGQSTNFIFSSGFISGPSTTQVNIQIGVSFPEFSATTINFEWRAMNATNAFPLEEGGSSSCSIPKNLLTCNKVITFAPTFAAAPQVFVQITTRPVNFAQTYPPLPIFTPDTNTV